MKEDTSVKSFIVTIPNDTNVLVKIKAAQQKISKHDWIIDAINKKLKEA